MPFAPKGPADTPAMFISENPNYPSQIRTGEKPPWPVIDGPVYHLGAMGRFRVATAEEMAQLQAKVTPSVTGSAPVDLSVQAEISEPIERGHRPHQLPVGPKDPPGQCNKSGGAASTAPWIVLKQRPSRSLPPSSFTTNTRSGDPIPTDKAPGHGLKRHSQSLHEDAERSMKRPAPSPRDVLSSKLGESRRGKKGKESPPKKMSAVNQTPIGKIGGVAPDVERDSLRRTSNN